ncbi:MAG: hypothetical protein R8F63_17550 [Acidimicrobiales bacterium]|nr:hypothetical protein [Acidimicrobiales bacterium]
MPSRRPPRIHRTIEHEATIHRRFADVLEIVERHCPQMLHVGTVAADRAACVLAPEFGALEHFDPDEKLVVVILDDASAMSARHCAVEFVWQADRDARLLANVSCRLDFRALDSGGQRATTEVRLHAEYDPPQRHRGSSDKILLGRRVVRAALDSLLDEIVRFVENYEETIELRLA